MFANIGINSFHSSYIDCTDYEISEYKNKCNFLFDLSNLEDYLLGNDNVLDVDRITQNYFPSVDADVFLSHSHHDERDIIKLAVALERKGLKVFVDSCVWGSVDVILKKIDNKFCKRSDGTYSYEKRNRTTSNVFMILNSALQNTISQCELFLFPHTENSLLINTVYENKKYIASPWIFSELSFAKVCQRSLRKKVILASESRSNTQELATDGNSVKFAYPNPGTHYTIENLSFHEWLSTPIFLGNSYNRLMSLQSLDDLYRVVKIPSVLLEEPRILYK